MARGNNFTSIKNISSLSTLKTINLGGNPLREIPLEDFEGLTQLTELSLIETNVQLKNSQFSKLTSLRKLYLSENNLKKLDTKWFQGLTNLLYLDIEENLIENFDYESLAKVLPSLETLKIYENPMSCAFIRIMSQYLEKKGNISVENFRHDYNYYNESPYDCENAIMYYGIISWIYLVAAILITVFIFLWDRHFKITDIFGYKKHENDENKMIDEEEIA